MKAYHNKLPRYSAEHRKLAPVTITLELCYTDESIGLPPAVSVLRVFGFLVAVWRTKFPQV